MSICQFVENVRRAPYARTKPLRNLVPRAEQNDILGLHAWKLDKYARSLVYAYLNDFDIMMIRVAACGRYSGGLEKDIYANAAAALSPRLYQLMLLNGHKASNGHLRFAMGFNQVETVKWFAKIHPNMFLIDAFITTDVECLKIAREMGAKIAHSCIFAMARAENMAGLLQLPLDDVKHALLANASLSFIRQCRTELKLSFNITNAAVCVILDRQDLFQEFVYPYKHEQFTISGITCNMTSMARNIHACMMLEPHAGKSQTLSFAIAHESRELILYLLQQGLKIDDALLNHIIRHHNEIADIVPPFEWTHNRIINSIEHHSPLALRYFGSLTAHPQQYINQIVANNNMDLLVWLHERGLLHKCKITPQDILYSKKHTRAYLHQLGMFHPCKTRKFMKAVLCYSFRRLMWVHGLMQAGEIPKFGIPWRAWARRRAHKIDIDQHIEQMPAHVRMDARTCVVVARSLQK